MRSAGWSGTSAGSCRLGPPRPRPRTPRRAPRRPFGTRRPAWSTTPRRAISWGTAGARFDSESRSRSTSAWPGGNEKRGGSTETSARRIPRVACCSEPLTGVAFGDGGPLGELERCGGPTFRKRPIQTQPQSQIHGHDVEVAECRFETPLGEHVPLRIALRRDDVHTRSSSRWLGDPRRRNRGCHRWNRPVRGGSPW